MRWGWCRWGLGQPCAVASCSWEERWQSTGTPLTFFTADNSRPPQAAPPRVTTVRLGMLLPMFGTEKLGYPTLSWSPRVGVYQALRELNNKSDGVADHLLPNTQLQVAYRDSHCDGSGGLSGALELTSQVFGGEGVSAIIGAGCSSATEPAAQVAALAQVPIISPSAGEFCAERRSRVSVLSAHAAICRLRGDRDGGCWCTCSTTRAWR